MPHPNQAARRSIPACAGEPVPPCLPQSSCGVYPRVCGGTSPPLIPARQTPGLSPRVRGNPWARKYCVYPRVCGGTFPLDRVRSIPACAGEPEGDRTYHLTALWRSIPACAGEPCIALAGCGKLEVYPRVCGGTLRAFYDDGGVEKVYPRVCGGTGACVDLVGVKTRSIPACAGEPGSALAVGLFSCRLGSIPACAGEPRVQAVGLRIREVYPRVCGGTLSQACRSVRRGRSIPACAGEPTLHACHIGRPVDAGLSPRVRGNPKVSLSFELLWDTQGLSPRVRGNPSDHRATDL